MRSVTSLFIALMMNSALASPINIYFEAEATSTEVIKEIFTLTYQIPEDLISAKPVHSCDQLMTKGKLDLCLKNNGDLLIVSVDREFISESLKIFRAP